MFGLLIILFLVGSSQSCKEDYTSYGDQMVTYIPNGEPFYVTCLLAPLESTSSEGSEQNYTITWFKTSSETEISTNIHTRIHQDNNLLKFIPARLEDSGSYICQFRTAIECVQVTLLLEVSQNDNGLCYKKEALYDYQDIFAPTIHFDCPYVTQYVDTEIAPFFWFKDCKPLDRTTEKYIISKDVLIITNVTPEDGGKYTCVTSFIHYGTEYNISRSMNLQMRDRQSFKTNVILHPTDNFIDAELDTPVTVPCQALKSQDLYYFSWMYNNSVKISEHSDNGRITEGKEYDIITNDGINATCQDLYFSTVKEEDYDIPFYCYALSLRASEDSKAFFILKRPSPNFQKFLIAFFVTAVLLVIITIIIATIFKVDLILWYRGSCFYSPQKNDGKKYDAYIMYPRNAGYTYDMDLFVLKLLPDVLEKQCAYRLFIIGRDDLPGQVMADVVDEAISQSRRLIIVLGQVSNITNLGEDFEQKITMYDALIRNEIKVILIEMEKITDYTVMPESINYIKQKQGVVRWKETFTEASLSPNTRFWKNIQYRMPPAPRHSDRDLDIVCTEDLLHEHDSL